MCIKHIVFYGNFAKNVLKLQIWVWNEKHCSFIGGLNMENNNIKEELVQLCNLAIVLLEKSKQNGLISEDQYNEHVKLKKDFLELNKNSES